MSTKLKSRRTQKPVNYTRLLKGSGSSSDDDFVEISPQNKSRKAETFKTAEKKDVIKRNDSNSKRGDINDRVLERHLKIAIKKSKEDDDDDDDFVMSRKRKVINKTPLTSSNGNENKKPKQAATRIGIQLIDLSDDEPTTETSCSSDDNSFRGKKVSKKHLVNDKEPSTIIDSTFSSIGDAEAAPCVDRVELNSNKNDLDSTIVEHGDLESLDKESGDCSSNTKPDNEVKAVCINEIRVESDKPVSTSSPSREITSSRSVSKDLGMLTSVKEKPQDGLLKVLDEMNDLEKGSDKAEQSVVNVVPRNKHTLKSEDVKVKKNGTLQKGQVPKKNLKQKDVKSEDTILFPKNKTKASEYKPPVKDLIQLKDIVTSGNEQGTSNINYVKPVNLPSLGLRLGLSRRAAIKPLHSMVKSPN